MLHSSIVAKLKPCQDGHAPPAPCIQCKTASGRHGCHLYWVVFLHGSEPRLHTLSALGQDSTQMERAPRKVLESRSCRGSR